MRSLIVWNEERVKALAVAVEEATGKTFILDLGKHGKHEFITKYARRLVAELIPVFDTPPQDYPENREGEEP